MKCNAPKEPISVFSKIIVVILCGVQLLQLFVYAEALEPEPFSMPFSMELDPDSLDNLDGDESELFSFAENFSSASRGGSSMECAHSFQIKS